MNKANRNYRFVTTIIRPTKTLCKPIFPLQCKNVSKNSFGKCEISKITLQKIITRSQAVARIADRTAKNCRGHVT